MTVHQEPYFKFWRFFVVETWGSSTINMQNFVMRGREGGPNILENVIAGDASNGSFTLSLWSTTFTGDDWVMVEFLYPVVPRIVGWESSGESAPKTVKLQASNDGREWFTIKQIDAEYVSGGGAAVCTVFTEVEIEVNGADHIIIVNDTTDSAVDTLSGCGMLVFQGLITCTNEGTLQVESDVPIFVNLKLFLGPFPDLSLFDEYDNLELLPGEPFPMTNLFGGEFDFVIAIQGYDTLSTAQITATAIGS